MDRSMRCTGFFKYLEVEETRSHCIKDTKVVIDASSYFYHLYQKSGLQYVYGCEGDKYARYLENHLQMLKKANIQCYFLFKGGNVKASHIIKYVKSDDFKPECDNNKVVEPVFTKDIHKQVLKKMNFKYTNCEFDVYTEVIALARKLNCPIIGQNHVTYCLSGVEYILTDSLVFDNTQNAIKCRKMLLSNLLEKYRLTPFKLSVFMVVMDESDHKSGKEAYLSLLQNLNMPSNRYKRSVSLLKWLARLNIDKALNIIYKFVNEIDFTQELEKTKPFMDKHIKPGIPSRYLTDNNFNFTAVDQHWFEKGVAAGYIPVQYINSYHFGVVFGAWTVEDYAANNSLLLSIKIICYVHNLLTNFKKSELIFVDINDNKQKISLSQQNGNVSKPVYEAILSPFENGWDQIKNLRLFEHFLEESLQGFNNAALKTAPEDAKLLIITLVYFTRQKTIDTYNIVCGVLLSYIMLTVVVNNLPDNNTCQKKESVTLRDCILANSALNRYFELTPSDCKAIFNAQLVHPFVEFQHMLVHMNFLNKLCGSPFMPTEYSKTFNGTFAYKFIYDAEFLESPSGLDLVKERLSASPTVLAFFESLLNIYREVLHDQN